MPTLFNGVNLALQAMLSQQTAMDVIENNVANANTPGYHRQSAVLTNSLPTAIYGLDHGGAGQIGTGVTVQQIQRFNSDYFDTQYRSANADAKKWGVTQDTLTQLQGQFAENGSDGLLPKLNDFWAGWQTVSTDPSNISDRQVLLDKTKALADALNNRASMLSSMRSDQDQAIVQRVNQINTMGSQIARLNAQISQVVGNGAQPNDLLDQRDQLLDQLSQITGSTSSPQTNGEVIVSIGGHVLVAGQNAYSLTTTPGAGLGGMTGVTWADTKPFNPPSGEIAGYLAARDIYLPNQQKGLDDLASGIITAVNNLHTTGYDLNGANGLALFTGTDALSMRLNPAITDPTMVAAAQTLSANPAVPPVPPFIPAPGDGGIALQIANYATTTMTINGQATTANDFYNAQVTGLGIDIQHATDEATYQGQVSGAVDTQRQSVGGVNLNEEAANMVKVQRSYEAAARLMSTVDSMMQTVINNMGVGG